MLSPKERSRVVRFSRIFRWTLGTAFLGAGIYAHDLSGIFFGAALFATGFLRPKRCLGDNDSAC